MIKDARDLKGESWWEDYLVGRYDRGEYFYVSKDPSQRSSKLKELIDPYTKTALSDADREYRYYERLVFELNKLM